MIQSPLEHMLQGAFLYLMRALKQFSPLYAHITSELLVDYPSRTLTYLYIFSFARSYATRMRLHHVNLATITSSS